MQKTSQLTRMGLFFVLGKLYYFNLLLTTKFDGEDDAPIGVNLALDELEEAKEPLLRLLLGPPDIRNEFTKYVQDTYGITVNLDFALPITSDETITYNDRLSVVTKDE